MKKFLLLITIYFFFLFICIAQRQNLIFHNLTIENGLSQNSILDICQDKYGFYWFATEEGVNKYDGYTFAVYKNNPDDSTSLVHNYVQSICKDSDGDLWLGTEGGLSMYDYDNDCFRQFTHSNDPNSLKNNVIVNLYPDPKGGLWISINLLGIQFYNKQNKTFTSFTHDSNNPNSLSNNQVNSVLRDRSGNLWFGTNSGLNKYIESENRFVRYFYEKPNPNSPFNNSIRSIVQDINGVIWVITNRGLEKFNPENGEFLINSTQTHQKHECFNSLRHLVIDKNNTLWISSPCGIWQYNIESKQFHLYSNNEINKHSISTNFSSKLYCDNDNLWIGSYGSGLNYTSLTPQGFEHLYKSPMDKNSLIKNDIFSLYEDNAGNLWIGTDGVLIEYSPVNKIYKNYFIPDNLKSTHLIIINSLLEDKDNNLWVGTSNGPIKFDRKTKTFKSYTQPVTQQKVIQQVWNIFEDSLGIVWFASRVGLGKYNKTLDEVQYYAPDSTIYNQLVNFDVRYIFGYSDEKLLLGVFGGLYLFNKTNNTFSVFLPNDKTSIKKGLNKDLIFCIHKISNDNSNNIWIGTDRGLVRLNTIDFSFKRYLEKDGLCNAVIFGIEEDKNRNLWISTSNGLSKFNPLNETFKNYYYSDGLQSNEFRFGAYASGNSGNLYFGGINGITLFKPENIRDNKTIPKIQITNFYLFNEPVKSNRTIDGKIILRKPIYLTDQITLSYKQLFFSFDFSAFNFIQTHRNQYAFKMEGLNEDWIDLGSKNQVSFNGIPPGNYTLHIKGSNNDGYWNTEGVSIKINIIPPFWKTKWFNVSLIFLIVLAIIMLYRLRIRSIKNHNLHLEELVKQRTNDLYEVNTQLQEKQTDLEIKQEEILAQRDSIEQQNIELRKLSLVASNTDNAIIIFDKTGKIEWFNEACHRLYGYTFDEFLKEIGDDLFKASKNLNIKNYFDQCLRNKESVNYETSFQTDNKTIWIQTTLSPILDDENEVEKFVAIDSNITELKTAELEIIQKNEEILAQNEEMMVQKEELEIHRNHLEKLVEEKTYDLIKAKEKAEESDKLKSAFLANMSHEIRTPMNAIIGFTNLLKDPEIGESNKDELISHIMHNSNTLLRLIDDIIDISRIEAGQLDVYKKDFRLINLFSELKNTYSDQNFHIDKKIQLVFKSETQNSEIMIHTDPVRLQQIFINLIDNAIKFTDNGFVEIGYFTQNEVMGASIVFYVKDTGIGLTEDKKELIFKRFQKLDSDKKKLYRGAGLGLAICKHLIYLLGGDIWFDSKINMGSTFYFSIPLLQGTYNKELNDKNNENDKKHGELENNKWSEKTILIAEDEESNYRFLEMILSKERLNIIRAQSGKEAVEKFIENKIDLILMDIKMPDMDGIEATYKIREINKNIPIIAQTAFAMQNDAKICFDAGCTDYLTKPIERNELIAKIGKYIQVLSSNKL